MEASSIQASRSSQPSSSHGRAAIPPQMLHCGGPSSCAAKQTPIMGFKGCRLESRPWTLPASGGELGRGL